MSSDEDENFGNRATNIRGIVALKMMILGFSKKRVEKDKQHEVQIFIHH